MPPVPPAHPSSALASAPPERPGASPRGLPSKFIDEKGLRARYPGVHRATRYRWQRNPKIQFPKPIKFGSRALWSVAELDAFDERMIAVRDRQATGGAAAREASR